MAEEAVLVSLDYLIHLSDTLGESVNTQRFLVRSLGLGVVSYFYPMRFTL